jgi:pimeloyl-ACP methyl ester carboxylesterase
VTSTVRRAFSPAPVPPAYLEIAPKLALQPSALAGDGEDHAAAEAGLAALRSRYPGLRVPLVIVAGDQDQMVPPAVSERLHALVPRSELVRVPGAGHMPQFSAPDVVVSAVDRAAELAGLAPGAAAGAASTFASPGVRG